MPTATPAAGAAAPAPVDTTKAPRRALRFTCLDCLRQELDRIDAAHRAGRLEHTGNWNAGEILDHCSVTFEAGLDGGLPPVPWFGRLLGRLFKSAVLKPGGMKPGWKFPKDAKELAPRPGVTFDAGMARLRRCLDRLAAGEKMTHPSPFLGRLTHDEWVRLNLNHTEMHLGFLRS